MIQAVVSIALYSLDPAACIFLPFNHDRLPNDLNMYLFGRIQSVLENVLGSHGTVL